MTQAVQIISDLPQDPLGASAQFFARHLDQAQTIIANGEVSALAIVLPSAERSHDDWRRSLARNLARKFTPKRVNVVGANEGESRDALLAYLESAPGVTGQYCAQHV